LTLNANKLNNPFQESALNFNYERDNFPYGDTVQHIAVLFQDGKAVAKREAGVE
jgi:hypothetical protein